MLKVTIVVLFLLNYGSFPCRADDFYTIVIKKQDEKSKTRWSLADWLDTRDKMRMQDLWLALHSPSPYEYYFGGTYQFNQANLSGPYNAWEIYFGAYATIFGLEGRYESGLYKRWQGLFNLRVFGYHDQSMNITLQTGLRSEDGSTGTDRSILAGVSFTFYIARYFGVEGLYRHYFPSTVTLTGVSNSGDLLQGGAFIDFKFWRFYVDYFSAIETLGDYSGAVAGTKIYF